MFAEADFSLTAEEARMASLAYAYWEQSQAESMAEYVHRRKNVDLSRLVDDVIQNELTDSEQQIIHLHYFDGLGVDQIAEYLKLHKSTVSKTLERGKQKIKQYLQYVIAYQEDLHHVTLLPIALREAMVTSAARHMVADTLHHTLQKLRLCEHLSLSVLSQAVSIPVPRLERLESGDALPDAHEILRLAAFYDISTDKLLKGE